MYNISFADLTLHYKITLQRNVLRFAIRTLHYKITLQISILCFAVLFSKGLFKRTNLINYEKIHINYLE